MNATVDKTGDQIAKERAAVDAMKNARSNMDAALSRISTLERALHNARSSIDFFKGFVPKAAYGYEGKKPMHGYMEDAVAEITKVLGEKS